MIALDGPSGGKEDLKKVAMGAGAGAILGGIFGGGKGAAYVNHEQLSILAMNMVSLAENCTSHRQTIA